MKTVTLIKIMKTCPPRFLPAPSRLPAAACLWRLINADGATQWPTWEQSPLPWRKGGVVWCAGGERPAWVRSMDQVANHPRPAGALHMEV